MIFIETYAFLKALAHIGDYFHLTRAVGQILQLYQSRE